MLRLEVTTKYHQIYSSCIPNACIPSVDSASVYVATEPEEAISDTEKLMVEIQRRNVALERRVSDLQLVIGQQRALEHTERLSSEQNAPQHARRLDSQQMAPPHTERLRSETNGLQEVSRCLKVITNVQCLEFVQPLLKNVHILDVTLILLHI